MEFTAEAMLELTIASRNAEQVKHAAVMFGVLKVKAQVAAREGKRAAGITSREYAKLGEDGTRHLAELVQAKGFKFYKSNGNRDLNASCWISW